MFWLVENSLQYLSARNLTFCHGSSCESSWSSRTQHVKYVKLSSELSSTRLCAVNSDVSQASAASFGKSLKSCREVSLSLSSWVRYIIRSLDDSSTINLRRELLKLAEHGYILRTEFNSVSAFSLPACSTPCKQLDRKSTRLNSSHIPL